MNAAAAEFLAELAAGIPALPRAACRRHRDLFDDVTPGAVAQAVEICTGCPELETCRRWADAQPPRTLTGVVAGVDRSYDFRRYSKENI